MRYHGKEGGHRELRATTDIRNYRVRSGHGNGLDNRDRHAHRAALRSDIAVVRDDMRVMRSDISDLRERMARVEVHVGVTAESP